MIQITLRRFLFVMEIQLHNIFLDRKFYRLVNYYPSSKIANRDNEK